MERCVGSKLEEDLPGFRFHPTEQELIEYYLSQVTHGKTLKSEIISMRNIYRHEPWELPGLAVGEREWYFFVRLDKKNGGNGGRPNRTTERGFWKATGSDKPIFCATESRKLIGMRKTLVFYKGRAPRGAKTDWIMNEYRLPDSSNCHYTAPPQGHVVLCKIYRKATSMKELEQRAAMEQVNQVSLEKSSFSTSADNLSSSDDLENFIMTSTQSNGWNIKNPADKGIKQEIEIVSESKVPARSVNEPPLELQVPTYSFDLIHDTLFTQLYSPWLDQGLPYANLVDFQFP
ncbi:NAC domain-containing protein 35 [Rhynchospora pubera]|uniref:NAC domain-containing protein 35 n=1 Tax=Rhynchospora pubera TaxID=906938 RepID=A0AAV8EF17_9POAL|nr:NAC domain-containing protein 35 [Rhynchospora pubera]